jgi:hypothetical protein
MTDNHIERGPLPHSRGSHHKNPALVERNRDNFAPAVAHRAGASKKIGGDEIDIQWEAVLPNEQ